MVSIDPIQIRMFQKQDISYFVREEMAQGWNSTEDKFHKRREDQQAGRCITLTAEYRGCPAGYLSVYWDSPWGPFGNAGYPEIVDLAVLEKYRNRGVGNRLMDEAEALAAQKGNFVYLGVGLHSGYGSAQRMYIKRGYLPDGSGVWYGNSVCPPYTDCRNDDELILYLYKRLSETKIEK